MIYRYEVILQKLSKLLFRIFPFDTSDNLNYILNLSIIHVFYYKQKTLILCLKKVRKKNLREHII
jgi:hypothetical protein